MKRLRDWGRLAAGGFRWGRRSVYLVVVLAAGALGWLHQVGLPGFAKAPLLAQLAQRGLQLEFERLRLRLTRGIVAEKVRLAGMAEANGPRLEADDVQVRLGWARILQGRAPEVTALFVHGARVEVPLTVPGSTNAAPLALDRITARLSFEGTNAWAIEELSARGPRGSVVARGSVTNVATWLARRRQALPRPPSAPLRWQEPVQAAVRWMEATRFDREPELAVVLNLDAMDPAQAVAEVRLTAHGISNGWAQATAAALQVRVRPMEGTSGWSRAEIDVGVEGARSRWLDAGTARWMARVDVNERQRAPGRAAWSFTGRGLRRVAAAAVELEAVEASGVAEPTRLRAGAEAPWRWPSADEPWAVSRPEADGFVSTLRLALRNGRATWSTNAAALGEVAMDLRVEHGVHGWREARADLDVTGLRSPWTGLDNVRLGWEATPNARPPRTDVTWEYLRPLAHIDACGWVESGRLDLPRVTLDGVSASWDWLAPWFSAGPFEARFGGGSVQGEGAMDVSSRKASATARSDADPHVIAPWLAPSAREQLATYTWPSNRPPHFQGAVGIRLPRWSGFDKPTREATLANLTLDADLDVGPLTFRGIPVEHAQGRITYTNRVWGIGPLAIRRPEGRASLRYENDERTREYHFAFESGLAPSMVGPLLDEKGQRELARVVLPVPPRIVGEAWGRWGAPEQLGVRAHVVATNATVRGEPIQWAEGDVAFTNGVVRFAEVRARSDGEAHVPGAAYDTGSKLLSFTNARATVPVWRVTRIIGAKTAATMEPYRFSTPPRSVVDGVVNVMGHEGTNIRFDIDADEFSWWKLRGTQVTARVRFIGETLRIEGLRAGFYGGRAAGDLRFDWSGPGLDAAYSMDLTLTNVGLRSFLADAWPGTNRLEGTMSGHGRVTAGRTSDPKSVVGDGRLEMRDGYLWGLPVFGLFSPLLDAISPGLGQTRFTSGTATYTMTNGLIQTRDLEMRSPTMRLEYGGTVDFGGTLDATMQAELFRDAPLIGRLLSLALSPVTKLFEYEVRGTLGRPQPEPRYIPRFLLILLKPVSLLRELLPLDDGTKAQPPPGP